VTRIHPPRGERFLVVRLAGREFAVEAGAVAAVMQSPRLDITPAAGPPGWSGLLQWQGRLLPVFWPNHQLGLPARPTTARTCILLLTAPQQADEPAWAMRVDSVSRYEVVARGYVRPGAQVRLGGKWRPILNVNTIWRDWLFAAD